MENIINRDVNIDIPSGNISTPAQVVIPKAGYENAGISSYNDTQFDVTEKGNISIKNKLLNKSFIREIFIPFNYWNEGKYEVNLASELYGFTADDNKVISIRDTDGLQVTTDRATYKLTTEGKLTIFLQGETVPFNCKLIVSGSSIAENIIIGGTYLPRVFYGLVKGAQTYRINLNTILDVANLPGINGDSFELYKREETRAYIPAVAIKINDLQAQIIISGDYLDNLNTFTAVNMRTGEEVIISIPNLLSLQEASYLGEFAAQDYQSGQVTVINDLSSGKTNVVFASVDFNKDGIFNWIMVGSYINGENGKSIFSANASTIETILSIAKIDETIIAAEAFIFNEVTFNIGDVNVIKSVTPLILDLRGNIRGPQGEQGIQGIQGPNGDTPYIKDNYWWIGDINLGVRAAGEDGQNGKDGSSFVVQTGLYSTIANWEQPGNVDPTGKPLLQLPALPRTDIEGKAFIVYDPLTNPQDPFYDLYFANNNDTTWTIVHPFGGTKGEPGINGYTPYIEEGIWYLNGVSTGVNATGPQGPIGPVGVTPKGLWSGSTTYLINDIVTYDGSAYQSLTDHINNTPPNIDTTNWQLFVAKGEQGPEGPVGINPMGQWVAENEYLIDDLVTYDGSTYISLTNHTDITTPPSQDAFNWLLFVQGTTTPQNLKTYNNITQFGVSDASTVDVVIEAMPSNSILVTDGSAMPNASSWLPPATNNLQATVTIKKINNTRTEFFYTHKGSGALYHANWYKDLNASPIWSGWHLIQTDNGDKNIKTYTTLAQLGLTKADTAKELLDAIPYYSMFVMQTDSLNGFANWKPPIEPEPENNTNKTMPYMTLQIIKWSDTRVFIKLNRLGGLEWNGFLSGTDILWVSTTPNNCVRTVAGVDLNTVSPFAQTFVADNPTNAPIAGRFYVSATTYTANRYIQRLELYYQGSSTHQDQVWTRSRYGDNEDGTPKFSEWVSLVTENQFVYDATTKTLDINF